MCEPFIIAKTGLSVREHLRRTVASYLRLKELAPDLPFIPVLQGWQLADYLECAAMYEAAGVDWLQRRWSAWARSAVGRRPRKSA